ncbi:uncharacterized protein LOC119305139 [Triticum dicoccoides]|uniref:uncharacterized protein LOC119305139 n=1 Tax=Triticum dicoccoides TaxID=85692 RepID=UPI00188E60EC|nr:uncharacterized protein LOC119305139 [Triticum dicoccoides]
MPESQQDKRRRVHEKALESMVTANGFFSTAIFVGLSGTVTPSPGIPTNCLAGNDISSQLVLFELLSFGCYLASTLVGHGTRLNIIHLIETTSREKEEPMVLRYKMVMGLSMLLSILGGLFLLISIIHLVQLKFGLLSCGGTVPWVLLIVLGPLLAVSLSYYTYTLYRAIKSDGYPEY